MQPFIKTIFVVVLLLFCIIAFSNSYSFSNIDNLAFATAIGIDVSETNNIKVTFQFVKQSPNNESSNNDNKVVTDTVEAPSITSAINIMNAYLDKKVDLSHCKIIIFSEEIAQNDITNYIYSLMNDIQVRPTANIIITKCTANDYIKYSEPSLETSVTKYYETFPKSSKYTGYIADNTIGDFFNSLLCSSCEPLAILGDIKSSDSSDNLNLNKNNSNIIAGNSSITSTRRTENLGLAAFNYGKFVGELNVTDSICYHILQNDINSFLISVPNPEKENEFIDVYITQKSNPKIVVKIVNGSPYIKINCKLNAKISSISENSKYLNKDVLNSISNSCTNYLSTNLTNYFRSI